MSGKNFTMRGIGRGGEGKNEWDVKGDGVRWERLKI